MKKTFRSPICAKHTWCLVVVLASLQAAWAAPLGLYRQGTVVSMRMGDCLPTHRGFMASFGAPAVPGAPEACPEYVLVSEKVVFVMVGKSSAQLVPLADAIDFRLVNNEIAVRIDDAKRESKFSIKEMILRSQWDLAQKHMQSELSSTIHPVENNVAMGNTE
ncbi:MAG TPA: hypothetical protein VMG31_08440 [Verrucomicrobiae bacterium]|nr:hypothetical protein [Verrucomicrobiae bacterium]